MTTILSESYKVTPSLDRIEVKDHSISKKMPDIRKNQIDLLKQQRNVTSNHHHHQQQQVYILRNNELIDNKSNQSQDLIDKVKLQQARRQDIRKNQIDLLKQQRNVTSNHRQQQQVSALRNNELIDNESNQSQDLIEKVKLQQAKRKGKLILKKKKMTEVSKSRGCTSWFGGSGLFKQM